MDKFNDRLRELALDVDAAIFAGDFTNFWFEGREVLAEFPFLLQSFEEIPLPVYFVRGNRDVNRALQATLPFEFENGIFLEGRTLPLADKTGQPTGFRVSGDPEDPAVTPDTILVTHFEERPRGNPGLHIAGHTHVARYKPDFLNAGFLYRTAEHGGRKMFGLFWVVEIEPPAAGGTVVAPPRFTWHVLEGRNDVPQAKRRYPFKEVYCETHSPAAGTFVVPFYWKKCPMCYD